MDAHQNGALDWVRERNRADISLPSGLGATIGLVRVQDAIAAGHIPLPVLREMDRIAEALKDAGDSETKKEAAEDELPPELLERGAWLRKEMARRTLKRIAPSVDELHGPDVDMPEWVIDELDQEDFDALVEYAYRSKPFPTPAGSPT